MSAPFLAAATGKVPRKALITVALTLFIAAKLAAAAAPTVSLLLAAGVAATVGAALFTPTASAAAVALARPARRGQALSIILGGLAVGTVLGVPTGTAIGQHLGWQASLLFIAAVALIALVGGLTTLPALPRPPAVPMHQQLALLANRQVVLIVAVSTAATGSGILVYSYIAHILERPQRALAALRPEETAGLPKLVDVAPQSSEGRLVPTAERALADFARHLELSARQRTAGACLDALQRLLAFELAPLLPLSPRRRPAARRPPPTASGPRGGSPTPEPAVSAPRRWPS